MPEASPTKWHLAHTTWFYETFILAPHAKSYQRERPGIRISLQLLLQAIARTSASLAPRIDIACRSARSPRVSLAGGFRYAVVSAPHASAGTALPGGSSGGSTSRQHRELIVTDVKHALWSSPLQPGYTPRETSAALRRGLHGNHGTKAFMRSGMLPVRAVLRQRGASPQNLFAAIPACFAPRYQSQISRVINDGGYKRAELWLSDGSGPGDGERVGCSALLGAIADGEW